MHIFFVSVEPVQKADVINITAAIEKGFIICSDDDWKQKLVGVGSDGAAMMIGKNNGVVRKQLEGKSFVVGVHCMTQRLELAFKDAVAHN